MESFVAAAFARFEQAFAADGVEDRFLVAGHTLAVRYAGTKLRARFMAAFQHLAAGAAEPALTICCWDGATSSVELPPSPWYLHDFLREGRIRGLISGPLIANFDAGSRLFQLLERRHGRALFHVDDARELPAWHDRCPFRLFISHWADQQRLALMHGAALAEQGEGVVLAGLSGSGKSTTALSCVLAGMDFLGDDACLIDPPAGTISSIYGRAKLEPDARSRLDRGPGLAGLGTLEPGEDPGTAVLTPARVVQQARLRAVLLLQIGATRASQLSSSLPSQDALEQLMPTVRAENHGLTPEMIAALAAVIDVAPVRRLTLGSDGLGVIEAVREAIA